MYDSILEKSGIGFSMYNSHKIVKSLGKTVANNYSVGGILKELIINKREYNEIRSIKEKLSIYLQNSKSKVVFFIDNIDRAESDNIIFLFKLIATIFDLPNVLYILSYDRERVEDVLNNTKKINPKYMEKIVQQEIRIPSIQREQLEQVYSVCVTNILLKYGVKEVELGKYKIWFSLICEKITDLRKFKRFINSILGTIFVTDINLDKVQLLSIESIRFLEPQLYECIRGNKKFFISHDKMADSSIYKDTFNSEKFNKEGKTFFTNLFEKYDSYREILSELFPYVDKYNKNFDLIDRYALELTENEKKQNANIYSAKYFDCYFSYGANSYLEINNNVLDSIKDIKEISKGTLVRNYLGQVIRNIKKEKQKEWFELFQNYIDNIPQNMQFSVALEFFYDIYCITNTKSFVSLSARERVELIITLLLEKISIEEITEFARKIELNYDKLGVIARIIFWLNNSKSDIKDIESRKTIVRQTYESMCREIEKSVVNLYQDEYYHRGNIWAFVASFESEEEKKIHTRRYVSSIISKENIIRIIGDLITTSIGTKYGYGISQKNVEIFFEDINDIDKFIKDISPKTDSEEFVMSVYQRYRLGDKNELWESDVYTDCEIELKL